MKKASVKEDYLNIYRSVTGTEVIDQLLQLAAHLKGIKIVHVNSTKEGGGVAEILMRMVPFLHALGLNVQWETIKGKEQFFLCTKLLHNLLQGQDKEYPSDALLKAYEKNNAQQAEELKTILQDADIVFIHDPQPLLLLSHFPQRKGKWVWRCHIDLSSPIKSIWDYLKKFVGSYDATIFSLQSFAPPLPHQSYFIPPGIDPLSDKNKELNSEEVVQVFKEFHINLKHPVLLQVSRYDSFKDPLGVIDAYRLTKKKHPNLQLVLAGGGALDDPEGEQIFSQVKKAADGDSDIYALMLPADSHRVINALQRGSTIVLQKSLREGFGLTVTEALWKQKPVIGGNTGGIRLQIKEGITGFLVDNSARAADRIAFLLQNPQLAKELGSNAKQHVLKHFLMTRQVQEYLTLMIKLLIPSMDLKRIQNES